MTLEEMRKVDPRTVDRNTLVQGASVKVTPGDSKWERIASFVEQIGNPYCYLDGDMVVKITYSDTPRTIEDCIFAYLGGV